MGDTVMHGADQDHRQCKVAPSPEEPNRGWGVPFSTVFPSAAEAESHKLVLVLHGWGVARPASIVGSMQSAPAGAPSGAGVFGEIAICSPEKSMEIEIKRKRFELKHGRYLSRLGSAERSRQHT